MLQLIPYGLAALVGGLLGKKYFPLLAEQTLTPHREKSPLVAETPSAIQLLGESLLQEESVVLATEEVPLDNRFGNKVLQSEHEFTRTASVGLNVGQEQSHGGQLKSSLWTVIESLVQDELKKNLHIEFGTQITRRVKISFSTEPGHRVLYRVVWKQASRRGLFDVRIGGEKHTIPYLVTFGLSHAVESVAEGEHAGT
ncbi:MAG: hypothetical protein HQL56_04530 [Magnetococcales bacterium]|nr:hypothetical protein [Magnetococcales bacterium]